MANLHRLPILGTSAAPAWGPPPSAPGRVAVEDALDGDAELEGLLQVGDLAREVTDLQQTLKLRVSVERVLDRDAPRRARRRTPGRSGRGAEDRETVEVRHGTGGCGAAS